CPSPWSLFLSICVCVPFVFGVLLLILAVCVCLSISFLFVLSLLILSLLIFSSYLFFLSGQACHVGRDDDFDFQSVLSNVPLSPSELGVASFEVRVDAVNDTGELCRMMVMVMVMATVMMVGWAYT